MKRLITNIVWLVFFAGASLFNACNSGEQANMIEPTVQALALENMDSTANPVDDFFQFVNGNWVERTEIPGDEGRWGSFNELRDDNNEIVLQVLEKAAKDDSYIAGSDERKVADFYASGMDSLLAEKVGTKPLQAFRNKIQSIQSVDDLQKYLSLKETYDGAGFMDFDVFPDLKNSKMMATYIGQGGLGLPDKEYYFKTDSRSKEIREKYVVHVGKMLQFLDYSMGDAAAVAKRIMALETRLAGASMSREEQRDIPALYNKFAVADLPKLAPSYNWVTYLNEMGVSGVDTVIVTQPKFIKEFESVIKTVPIADWKVYLDWHLIDGASQFLNHEIVKANFDFYGKELRGTEKMRPRWKRVLGTTNGAIGEALGKLYVSEAFPPEAKENAQEMVDNILAAFGERIQNLDWMSDETKQKSMEKLGSFTVKIGYPDEWRDYSKLVVEKAELEPAEDGKGSFFNNVLNAEKFEFERELDKLGKPVDKKEWGMSPQTVNAYYNPLFNEIVFPAAILQPPFYNYKADAAVNYGGIGAVIGHEISHGFDDQGSRFDAAGNMVNWWTEEDSAQFKSRTAKLVDQYSSYEPLDSVNVNGNLTLGENIGDLGGVSVAYDGLQRHLAKNGRPENIDGFTPEQRFFISWGTVWRIKYRDETLRTQINTDPHSPGMYRANGPIANFPAFYKAFGVKEGDGMHRPDSSRVAIW